MRTPTKAEIGDWLRRAREGARDRAESADKPGFAQEGIAQRLGVRERAVRMWEKGRTAPPADKFLALVKLYRAERKLLVLLGNWEGGAGLLKGPAGGSGDQQRKVGGK